MKLSRILKNPIAIALAVCVTAGLITMLLVGGAVSSPDDNDYFEKSRAPLVNINEASVSQLTVLDGIGYTRAEAIVNYRAKYGPFQSIRDIMNVPGIGEGIFYAIRNQIYV